MNVHCARTYGCVKLIEEALTRPPHRPKRYQPHLADEYAALGELEKGVSGRFVAGELRRPWMRELVAGEGR